MYTNSTQDSPFVYAQCTTALSVTLAPRTQIVRRTVHLCTRSVQPFALAFCASAHLGAHALMGQWGLHALSVHISVHMHSCASGACTPSVYTRRTPNNKFMYAQCTSFCTRTKGECTFRCTCTWCANVRVHIPVHMHPMCECASAHSGAHALSVRVCECTFRCTCT
jgi:hypothetical protein